MTWFLASFLKSEDTKKMLFLKFYSLIPDAFWGLFRFFFHFFQNWVSDRVLYFPREVFQFFDQKNNQRGEIPKIEKMFFLTILADKLIRWAKIPASEMSENSDAILENKLNRIFRSGYGFWGLRLRSSLEHAAAEFWGKRKRNAIGTGGIRVENWKWRKGEKMGKLKIKAASRKKAGSALVRNGRENETGSKSRVRKRALKGS